MAERIPLYPWSRKEARRLDEMKEWTDSYQANCACARAVELAIKDNYDGTFLDCDCTQRIIDEYGFDRVNHVLANTVQDGVDDGRYSPENKQWARAFSIPHEEHHFHRNFAVNAHPGLVNIFVNQARRLWDGLGLYEKSQCYDESTQALDYTGKVVVIRPSSLADEYKNPDYQLFYASGGNGCRPDALGTKVFGQYLKDGEKDCYVRGDILGAMKLELMPEWAQEKYAEITSTDSVTETLKMGEPT